MATAIETFRYEVRDSNGKVIRTCATRAGANRCADKRNAAHGSYRYTVARIPA